MILVRQVVGDSMLPALKPGRIVIGLTKFFKPGLFDVVVFEHDGKEKIKRLVEIDGNRVYLIGDNRDASTDSRQFGWLPKSAIKAKIVWPRPYMK